MVFLSAGHNSKSTSIAPDPGAIGVGGLKEGDLTIEFRDLVSRELDLLGVKHTNDSDDENLAMYLKRIVTGNGSVVIEYHFNAGVAAATGAASVIQIDADRLDKAFAKELVDSVASVLGIKNRGTESEADTPRKRLGLMREQGIVCLVELCFITNQDDIARYNLNKKEVAKAHALIIQKYEAMIP